MGRNTHADDRIEQIGTIEIAFETFKKALKRDYLSDRHQNDGRKHRIRISPPFDETVEAKYFESEQGTHYPPDMSPKPIHIRPSMIFAEDMDTQWIPEYPTRANTRDALSEDEIEGIGGLDAAVEEGREIFWNDLKAELPETITLGQYPQEQKEVSVEWTGIDE
jgi:hypothetical protein